MTRNIRSNADLELSTALTHAPRSLVRGEELQHPRRCAHRPESGIMPALPSPSVSHAARAIHLPLLRMGRQKAEGNCLHQCAALGEVDRRVFAARRRGPVATAGLACAGTRQ